jgi:uncharacterized protein YqiB (DUF1249 family)
MAIRPNQGQIMCYAFFMVSFRKRHGQFLRPKLKRLQDLQTEIFRQLQLLIPDQVAHYDSFQSQVAGSPLLRMDILERHPYTHFLRMTYQFNANEQPEIAPDAHIRIYNDARLAEVTSFNPEQGFKRPAHGPGQPRNGLPFSPAPWYPQHQFFQRIWRQNRAMDKWLGYLLHQGHNLTSMRPAGDRISGLQAIPVKETAGGI